jgi:hypothetical protein
MPEDSEIFDLGALKSTILSGTANKGAYANLGRLHATQISS